MGKIYEPKFIRNVSLSGAPNVGKTTLAESLLYASGQIKEMGDVNRGNTVMDFDDEEIAKKMSLHSSLAHTEWKNIKINLIDTPGIPDLVADVRSAFRVTEGIIFVVSATEGLTIDMEKDWHFADDYQIARLLFINKMDEEGADFYAVAESLDKNFKKPVIPIQLPIGSGKDFKGTVDLVHMKAFYPDGNKVKEGEIPADMQDKITEYRDRLFDAVAETDDTLIEKYLEGEELTSEEVEKGLKTCTMNNKFIPVMCGSAVNNIGTFVLLDMIISFLPSPLYIGEVMGNHPEIEGEIVKRHPDPLEPFSGFVFKTRIDPFAGRVSYCRIRSGILLPGSEVYNSLTKQREKIGKLYMANGKNLKEIEKLEAGDIAVLAKMDDVETGTTLSFPEKPIVLEKLRFPKPSYFVAIHAADRKAEDKLAEAFHTVATEDPTFNYSYNDITKEMVVSCIGETQGRLIFESIKHRYKFDFLTRAPRVAYKETITRHAEGYYKHKKQSGGHGQYGEVYLKLDPLKRDEGFEFKEEIFGGAIPKNYFPAIEKGAMEACEKGVIAGYPVVDIKVTLYDGSFHDVDSSDMAFKIAGLHATRLGIESAKPVILEPVAVAKVYVNEDAIGNIMSDISTKRGKVLGMEKISEDTTVINVQAPYSEMLVYSPVLNSLTSGRGRFEMEISHYEILPETEYARAKRQAEEMEKEMDAKKD